MNDVLEVAKYVIDYCTRRGTPISNLQLQKILYYIQLEFYEKLGEAAFEDTLQAWQYGPVSPKVYDAFYCFGATKICNLYESARSLFNDEQEELANKVIEKCVKMSVRELIMESHKPGSPWEQVYRGNAIEIPNNLIMDYARKV